MTKIKFANTFQITIIWLKYKDAYGRQISLSRITPQFRI